MVLTESEKQNIAAINALAERFSSSSLEQYETSVREIIKTVRTDGDKALRAYNAKFDDYQQDTLAIDLNSEAVTQQISKLSPDLISAIDTAKARIEKFHLEELKHSGLEQNWSFTGELGESLGVRYQPIDSIAVYIPGGQAPLLSTVLMTAIPAKAAGVRRIVMVSPPSYGGTTAINPAMLAAAKAAGVNEVYAVGGAQAVAALAYGTETIEPVDKIVGPGNIFVSIAKKEVFGKVGIDGIYGPSELAVIADESADPALIAADLLGQLEHGSGLESTLLVTTSEEIAQNTKAELEDQIKSLADGHKTEDQIKTIRSSLERWSALLVAKDMEEASRLINIYAPEHLEIMVKPETQEQVTSSITNAGAIFIGSKSCESLGDYIAGPSHCLPTAGSSRFSSGLQAADFIKKSSLIDFSSVDSGKGFEQCIQNVANMARAEQLEAHARAMEARKESK